MSATVISVENLSKQYRLGLIGGATFREEFERWWAKRLGRPDPWAKIGQADHGNRRDGYIWALRDVSFDLAQGEILGIVGRNGAGKSTLLKILSRIVTPTTGRIRIKGRVASLLEVGTGFHPELTGRENIYLNGAILGMTKAEIQRKIDEIIAFSEIETFIDTPVKRYSSGMTVRLAFSVAAHLEPEILVVDEVLAVGDAAFQKKCIGKMEDVSRSGRTVLFVSHNMPAVRSLCTRAVLLAQGTVEDSGTPEDVISRYLMSDASNDCAEIDLASRTGRKTDDAVITRVWIEDGAGERRNDLFMGEVASFCFAFDLNRRFPNFGVTFGVEDEYGKRIFTFNSYMVPNDNNTGPRSSGGVARAQLPALTLNPGTYTLTIALVEDNRTFIDTARAAIAFHVHPADVYGTGNFPIKSDGVTYVQGAIHIR